MAEPSSGGTVLARKAGARTPVSSGLTRKEEVEAILSLTNARIQVLGAEERLKRDTLGAFANIVVSFVNSHSNVLSAVTSAQREGRLANEVALKLKIEANKIYGEDAQQALMLPESTETFLQAIANNMKMRGVKLSKEVIKAVEEGSVKNPEEAINILKNGFSRQLQVETADGQPLWFEMTDELTPVKRHQIRSRLASHSRDQIQSSVYDVYSHLSQKRASGQLNPIEEGLFNKLQNDSSINDIVAVSIGGTSDKFILSSSLAQDDQKQSGEELKKYEEEQLKIAEGWQRYANSVGVPRGISEAIGSSVNFFKDMSEKGIDGFSQSLNEVPVPTSLLLEKQALAQQIREIEDPQDPLTQTVNRTISRIPRFEAYVSAMGFKDAYRAYDYMKKHPATLDNYLDVIAAFPEEFPTMDQYEIAARMKVMASEGKHGRPIRFTWGSKGVGMSPLERVLGVAVNKPAAWRSFSGTNTVQQLTNAIQALESDPKGFEVKRELERDPAEYGKGFSSLSESGLLVFERQKAADENYTLEQFNEDYPKETRSGFYSEVEEPPVAEEPPKFSLPLETEYTPREKRRLKRAAERYREQIGGPEATRRDRETASERFERKGRSLKIEGREPQPFLPPAPEPVSKPAIKTKTTSRTPTSIGGTAPLTFDDPPDVAMEAKSKSLKNQEALKNQSDMLLRLFNKDAVAKTNAAAKTAVDATVNTVAKTAVNAAVDAVDAAGSSRKNRKNRKKK